MPVLVLMVACTMAPLLVYASDAKHKSQDSDLVASISDMTYPGWFENVVSWYRGGLISDSDFSGAINYVLDKGIAKRIWHPKPGIVWDVQLNGVPERFGKVDAYIVDLFDADKTLVEDLHKNGTRVICYLNAGSWEDWRTDASKFDDAVIGNDYEGWPGEKWLDIRNLDVLGPIMQKRLDLCKEKGFDGVEPDNLDGYAQETGFEITYGDQITYNKWLAEQAHKRGLAIGLKNDLRQVHDLVDYFDWASNEQCVSYGECNMLVPFLKEDKAVLHIEYGTDDLQSVCDAVPAGFSTLLKTRSLDGVSIGSCIERGD